jgi:hypothetical protein
MGEDGEEGYVLCVGYGVISPDEGCIYSAPTEMQCHEHINDAINEWDIEGASKWVVRQLLCTTKVLGQL